MVSLEPHFRHRTFSPSIFWQIFSNLNFIFIFRPHPTVLRGSVLQERGVTPDSKVGLGGTYEIKLR